MRYMYYCKFIDVLMFRCYTMKKVFIYSMSNIIMFITDISGMYWLISVKYVTKIELMNAWMDSDVFCSCVSSKKLSWKKLENKTKYFFNLYSLIINSIKFQHQYNIIVLYVCKIGQLNVFTFVHISLIQEVALKALLPSTSILGSCIKWVFLYNNYFNSFRDFHIINNIKILFR